MAEAFHQLLFVEHRIRLGHHLAHVAPESWLTLELSMLVNEKAAQFGMEGWTALVERQRVDVTLVPPGCDPNRALPTNAVYVELKLCGTDWWNAVWPDIGHDLNGTATDGRVRSKPRAHLAVCLLYDVISPSLAVRRPDSTARYKAFLSRVPFEPSEFEPVEGQRFYLLKSSSEHRISWQRPVFSRWPKGFEANARLLWLSLPPAL